MLECCRFVDRGGDSGSVSGIMKFGVVGGAVVSSACMKVAVVLTVVVIMDSGGVSGMMEFGVVGGAVGFDGLEAGWDWCRSDGKD